jgi:hypothetical protein
MSKDMIQNPTCKVQQLFVWCIRSWLEYLETPQPDVSLVPEGQRDWFLRLWRNRHK